jgi:hypothetical protein
LQSEYPRCTGKALAKTWVLAKVGEMYLAFSTWKRRHIEPLLSFHFARGWDLCVFFLGADYFVIYFRISKWNVSQTCILWNLNSP